MAFRALSLFAAVFARDLDLMPAALALKHNDGRPFRHDYKASALRAFAFLARIFLFNADDSAAA